MILVTQNVPGAAQQTAVWRRRQAGEAPMDIERRLEELLEVVGQLGLEVRRESLSGSGGGLCVMKGRRVLFVDTAADLDERYERVLSAVAGLAELEQRYLSPDVREDLERAVKS